MTMTFREAFEYVDNAQQAEGEQFAEWGMGATSLGLNAAEWAPDYDGYRCANDPTYAEAKRICDLWREETSGFTIHYYGGALDPRRDLPF